MCFTTLPEFIIQRLPGALKVTLLLKHLSWHYRRAAVLNLFCTTARFYAKQYLNGPIRKQKHMKNTTHYSTCNLWKSCSFFSLTIQSHLGFMRGDTTESVLLMSRLLCDFVLVAVIAEKLIFSLPVTWPRWTVCTFKLWWLIKYLIFSLSVRPGTKWTTEQRWSGARGLEIVAVEDKSARNYHSTNCHSKHHCSVCCVSGQPESVTQDI